MYNSDCLINCLNKYYVNANIYRYIYIYSPHQLWKYAIWDIVMDYNNNYIIIYIYKYMIISYYLLLYNSVIGFMLFNIYILLNIIVWLNTLAFKCSNDYPYNR